MNALHRLYLSCPPGIEGLLALELRQLGLEQITESVSGVFCQASFEQIYGVCFNSRLANRVVLVLKELEVADSDDLYELSKSIHWENIFTVDKDIRVDFMGANRELRHSQYGAQVVKDAIVDRFYETSKQRPSVSVDNPQIRIYTKIARKLSLIGLDLSGDSLFKRGYRQGTGVAPIKENLAAALLLRAGWPKIAERGGEFIDPMCGSATILIEAAMMAANVPAGLYRASFGFEHWMSHDSKLWQEIKQTAFDQFDVIDWQALPVIKGYEHDLPTYQSALKNLNSSELSRYVSVEHCDFRDAEHLPTASSGLILCNPPYGMRLGEEDELNVDYADLASIAKANYPGWRMGIISSNQNLLQQIRLRADKKFSMMNGPIPCEFRIYGLSDKKRKAQVSALDKTQISPMLENRLRKNLKKLQSWRNNNGISCYRVYDSDLPEYAAAIDVYDDKLHIQEYQAPASIDKDKAASRLLEIIGTCAKIFECDSEKIYLKTRRVNKGLSQYEKLDNLESLDFFLVQEGKANLLVNLKSFLDSGLFLDHRYLRLRLAEESLNKSFLNLFCYTATATVHSALGGAKDSVSVDMSNTYLDWARNNYKQNNINLEKHVLVRADVLSWLQRCRQGFDIIMLDPPSFSNSKKMKNDFDVQRDHKKLIIRCMEILNPGGVLFFSNNFRRFKIDPDIESVFQVKNISSVSIGLDFQRNKRIHQCFEIRAMDNEKV